MSGEISDSYDPEFGTAARAADVRDALARTREAVLVVLQDRPSVDIADLLGKSLPIYHSATLSEQMWRLILFSIDRTIESI